jgi:hypothetical protein
MKYDIPCLLALRGNASIDIGKFSIHALESKLYLARAEARILNSADNLLGRRKANPNVLAERSINRSRVPSSVSVTQNENLSSGVPEDKPQYPRRQPRNAPRSTLAQADSGFAQFLKEHTSPKHHRVTAGGRIVPMNADKSVPEFKPPAKKTKDDDPKKLAGRAVSGKGRKRNTASGTSTKSFSGCFNVNNTSTEANPVTPATSGTATLFTGPDASGSEQPHTLHQTTQLPVPALITPFYQQQPLSFPSNTYPLFQLAQTGQECIPLLANLTAAHQTTDALGWFPSMVQPFAASSRHIAQSPPPPFNPSLVGMGSSFQMAANRGGLTTKPGAADSLSAVSSYPFTANAGNFSPYTATPLASYPVPLSGYITDPAAQRSLQDVTKEYENLTSQLINLDRYMAIHTFEMDASMKKTLVEQRKGLVLDLDAARRYKEHLESSLRQSGPRIIDAETASNLRLQPNLLQAYAGDAANNFGVSAAAWMSPMMANNVQPAWIPNPLGDFQTSSLPFTHAAFNTRAALQFPMLGSLPSIPDIGSWSEYQPNVSEPYSDSMAKQDCSTGKSDMPPCKNTQTSQAPDDGIQTDGRTTSMNSAPLEIRRVYRKIEEAAKRGEPFEGLLRELAKITELFVSRQNVRCDSPAEPEHHQASSKPSNMDILGVAPSQISPKEHQKKEEGGPPISTIATEGDDVTKPGSCGTETRMCTCKIVRRQMSDDEGEDGASCCSCVSVADSWATTEERE